MTDMLREIEKGHEAKFKLDEELRFKVRCRAAKLFGLWAAERLGQAHEEGRGYAQRLVARCAEAPGAGVVLDDVGADFAAAGVKMS
ncbi:MAG: ATPase inhibitor subunit zeta, partial [Rhodospirillales bacterium]